MRKLKYRRNDVEKDIDSFVFSGLGYADDIDKGLEDEIRGANEQ
jgi:hypothetical protein